MNPSDSALSFRPSFEGMLSLDLPPDWHQRIQARIDEGFLVPGRKARANYRVTAAGPHQLVFEAGDFATAYAIGLNHVELWLTGKSLAYRVSFARWNRYVVAHGALLGVALILASFHPSLRGQIDSLAWIFWLMVGFWSLAWPWIMTAIHRPFARRTLERILLEELGHKEPPKVHAAS